MLSRKVRLGNIGCTLTNSHVSSEVCPSLPRFDGTALNNVHYAVEVEGSVRLNAVRWTVAGKLNEQLVRPARPDWRVLPPARQRGLRTPQRFKVHQLRRKVRVYARYPKLMSARSSSPAASAVALSFSDFLSHGYRYIRFSPLHLFTQSL
jgi:hypothetical protein